MVTAATDVNLDPGFPMDMDPDMALGGAQAWMTPWPLVAAQTTQISMAQLLVDMNMVSGDRPEPGHPHGLG